MLKRRLAPVERECLQQLRPEDAQSSEQVQAQVGKSLTACRNALIKLVGWEYARRTRNGHHWQYVLTPLGQRKLAWEMTNAADTR